MVINRIQKLLFSEYCDFEDLVLIESPFAQTTKEGRGIRQVHLGLTPTKLILATDILPPIEEAVIKYSFYVDPEIETFELIAIYPVQCVNLSIYSRKKRQTIKAHFCNNRVSYFELGGFEKRGMFWNLWCEKIKFLCPPDSTNSYSETSVATSTTSGSSLYLIEKKMVAVNGLKQLWCKFGPNHNVDTHFLKDIVSNNIKSLTNKWTDKHLYFGEDLKENAADYKPLMTFPEVHELVRPHDSKDKKQKRSSMHLPLMEEKQLNFGDSIQVNRFGSGIYEGCRTGLFLTADDYVPPTAYDSIIYQTSKAFENSQICRSIDYEELAEIAVLIWEYSEFYHKKKYRIKHRRRYGFAPQPLFLYGLGRQWDLTKGDKYSLQLKRASSAPCLTNYQSRMNLNLSISKRQLLATISCPILDDSSNYRTNNIINAYKKPLIIFWTPGYWYRPVSAKKAYMQVQRILKNIKSRHEANQKRKRRTSRSRKFLRKFSSAACKAKDTDEEDISISQKGKRQINCISNMLSVKMEADFSGDEIQYPNESPLEHLKRLLKLDVELSVWDFDSTTLAHQLTLIDKDLFLRIPSSELAMLLWQQSCKNTPNIIATIAFSHRISCLIASEILKDENERARARLMARFINVANKCHRISNFQSCRSVLCGLQNPAIFRLRKTWAYMRKKHASKYQVFEFLCRLYRDPRMPIYQKTFFIFSQRPPFLPFIGDIIARLLNKVPEYKFLNFYQKSSNSQLSFNAHKTTKSIFSLNSSASLPKVPHSYSTFFSKIFNVFTLNQSDAATVPNQLENNGATKTQMKKANKERKTITNPALKFKSLYEYYKPLNYYEDRREEILIEITKLLEKCQLSAVNYGFNCNEVARNFLLKSIYCDDQDNFFNSLIIESAKTNNKNNNKND